MAGVPLGEGLERTDLPGGTSLAIPSVGAYFRRYWLAPALAATGFGLAVTAFITGGSALGVGAGACLVMSDLLWRRSKRPTDSEFEAWRAAVGEELWFRSAGGSDSDPDGSPLPVVFGPAARTGGARPASRWPGRVGGDGVVRFEAYRVAVFRIAAGRLWWSVYHVDGVAGRAWLEASYAAAPSALRGAEVGVEPIPAPPGGPAVELQGRFFVLHGMAGPLLRLQLDAISPSGSNAGASGIAPISAQLVASRIERLLDAEAPRGGAPAGR